MEHEGHKGHKGHEGEAADAGETSRIIVDAGLKVHRALGPGLLESAHEKCLAHELGLRGCIVRRQVPLSLAYEGMFVDVGYRLDPVVDEAVVVEVKSVEALTRLHQAQLLTYLRLSGLKLGLLMNFNVELFKDGIRRLVV